MITDFSLGSLDESVICYTLCGATKSYLSRNNEGRGVYKCTKRTVKG